MLVLACAVALHMASSTTGRSPDRVPVLADGRDPGDLPRFRINASYDRYWEGRKYLGTVLVVARNLARQALTQPSRGVDARPFVLG